MEKPKEIKSLNDKLFTDFSIEELEKRLQLEELGTRGNLWDCDCDDTCSGKVSGVWG